MADPIPTPDPRFVTLDDLADWLRAPDKRADAALSEALDAALEWAAEQLYGVEHTDLLRSDEQITRTYRLWPSGHSLVLPDTHLQAVSEVRSPTGDVVDVPESLIDLLAGVIEVQTIGRLAHGLWTVTATPRNAGQSVSMAIKIVASHLYEVQRGRTGDARSAMALGGTNPVGETPGRSGFAIPHRAAQLIKPYLRGQ